MIVLFSAGPLGHKSDCGVESALRRGGAGLFRHHALYFCLYAYAPESTEGHIFVDKYRTDGLAFSVK